MHQITLDTWPIVFTVQKSSLWAFFSCCCYFMVTDLVFLSPTLNSSLLVYFLYCSLEILFPLSGVSKAIKHFLFGGLTLFISLRNFFGLQFHISQGTVFHCGTMLSCRILPEWNDNLFASFKQSFHVINQSWCCFSQAHPEFLPLWQCLNS